MRKIYENIEMALVGHYQSILESEGIRTHIKNLGAATAVGEIPFQEVFPELWVVDDADYESALEVLRPYYCQDLPAESPWTCPRCGEEVEGTMGECWNCQTPVSEATPATEENI